MIGSIERRFLLIRSWTGVVKASYGPFRTLIDSVWALIFQLGLLL